MTTSDYWSHLAGLDYCSRGIIGAYAYFLAKLSEILNISYTRKSVISKVMYQTFFLIIWEEWASLIFRSVGLLQFQAAVVDSSQTI